MNSLKKLKTSICASFEAFVNDVENKEALAESAISDLKKVLGNIRVQNNGLAHKIKFYQSLEEKLMGQKTTWDERAMKMANRDSEMAKNCIKRSMDLEKEIRENQTVLKKLHQYSQQVLAEQNVVEGKLKEMEAKKNLLSARDSAAKVGDFLDRSDSFQQIDQLFLGWEEKIIRGESINSVGASFAEEIDELEDLFKKDELDEELNKRLAELKKN